MVGHPKETAMPVIDSQYSMDDLTITLTSQFDAPVDRVWQVWSDPRQLERWWGPPSHPATVTDFEFEPGGTVKYYMTGPEGEKFGGWWKITSIDAPRELQFTDGFADADGNPVDTAPVSTSVVQLVEYDNGTRMTVTSSYASADELQKILDMGAIEGSTLAGNQIDAILAG